MLGLHLQPSAHYYKVDIASGVSQAGTLSISCYAQLDYMHFVRVVFSTALALLSGNIMLPDMREKICSWTFSSTSDCRMEEAVGQDSACSTYEHHNGCLLRYSKFAC